MRRILHPPRRPDSLFRGIRNDTPLQKRSGISRSKCRILSAEELHRNLRNRLISPVRSSERAFLFAVAFLFHFCENIEDMRIPEFFFVLACECKIEV